LNDKGYSRIDRVSAAIVKILAVPVSNMARDSGAGMATVSKVVVSPDLRRATITISLYAESNVKMAFKEYLGSQGYLLQKELAGHLKSKRTPVLDFKIDEEVEVLDRISRLLSDDRNIN
jgi:ribosome-binding factor A